MMDDRLSVKRSNCKQDPPNRTKAPDLIRLALRAAGLRDLPPLRLTVVREGIGSTPRT